ncbi:hypothetical protein ACFXTO_047170 [Malus domestica]
MERKYTNDVWYGGGPEISGIGGPILCPASNSPSLLATPSMEISGGFGGVILIGRITSIGKAGNTCVVLRCTGAWALRTLKT